MTYFTQQFVINSEEGGDLQIEKLKDKQIQLIQQAYVEACNEPDEVLVCTESRVNRVSQFEYCITVLLVFAYVDPLLCKVGSLYYNPSTKNMYGLPQIKIPKPFQIDPVIRKSGIVPPVTERVGQVMTFVPVDEDFVNMHGLWERVK